jgi:hypothetical protein
MFALSAEWNLPPARHLSRQALHAAHPEAGAVMGEMKRANAHEEERRLKDRFASTLVIAASIIAAVRLARVDDIDRPSPRLMSAVSSSIALARMILDRIVR